MSNTAVRRRPLLAVALGLLLVACSPPLAPTPTTAPSKPPAATQPPAKAAPTDAPTAKAPAAEKQAAQPSTDSLYEAAKKEGALVIYGSGEQAQWEPLRQGFIRRYPGIDAQVQAQRGRDTREKIIAEQAARRVVADIVSAGPDSTTELDQQGFLEAYRSPQLQFVRPDFLDPRDILAPRNVNVYGITINTRLIGPSDEPRRWADLTDPRYKGKLAMQDPRGSGGGMTVFTALLKVHGEEFLQKLAQQNIFMGTQTAQIRTELVRGEHAILLTDTAENVFKTVGEGAPLKFIRPEEGVAVTPISVTVVKNAPHPNAAKLFVDWILSEEGQAAVAEGGSTPVRSGVPVKSPEYGIDGAQILPRDDQESDPARAAELTRLWERIFFKQG